MRGVVDVQEEPVAAAGPAGEADFRVDRDVVTLGRTGRRPGIAAASPSAGASAASFPTAGGRRRGSRRGAIARVRGVALGTARRYREALEDAR